MSYQWTTVFPRCVTCGCSGIHGQAMPTVLADALANSGRLERVADWGYAVRTVCTDCLTAAARGDTAPSGVDMPTEFYHAMARDV